MYSRHMTTKSLIINLINDSVDTLYRNARALPADKLTWEPTETNRSALSMLQECVQSPTWTITMLNERRVGDFSEEAWGAMQAERAQWDTIDKCEAECRARIAKLIEAIEAFPDADLETTLFLPFTQKDHPYWDIMMYVNWNNVWHTGQIAYLQVMLGDKEMH